MPRRKTGRVEKAKNQAVPPVEKIRNYLGILCPICLETPSGDNVAATGCGHIFCLKCIQLSALKNKTCPVCRSTFKKYKIPRYHQLFIHEVIEAENDQDLVV